MKKMILPLLLAVSFAYPVFADQKSDIQQKYDAARKHADQSYDENVSDAKAKYQDNDTKLNDALNTLKSSHENTINDLNHQEKVELQKAS